MGANNHEAGRIAGAAMGKYAKDTWNCDYTAYISLESTGAKAASDARMGGFRDGFKESCPLINEKIQPDVDRTDKAIATMADVFTATPGNRLVVVGINEDGVIGALEETPDAELRAVMETNFFGAMAVIMAALPVLRAQRFGAIVNMSSFGGQLSFAGAGAYSASKFALEGASEALAQELAPFGIKVLIVEPGAFRTGFAARALRHMPVMDAYQDAVGPMRAFAHAMNNTQEGDPRKAVKAIEAALDAAATPLRLQLGADAVAAVRAHAETLLADLAGWERIATNTRLGASQEICP